jgi:hypothetical protein
VQTANPGAALPSWRVRTARRTTRLKTASPTPWAWANAEPLSGGSYRSRASPMPPVPYHTASC